MPDKVVNKVVFGNQTLMDVTDATATSGDILTGKSAYVADGTRAVGSLEPMRWAYRSTLSANNITEPGIYYCDGCADMPNVGSAATVWSLTVVPSAVTGSSLVIKQTANAITSGYRFERYFLNNVWSSWVDTNRTIAFRDDLSTTKYYRKPGSQDYGTFLILGIGYNVGALAVLCRVANGSLTEKKNLLDGNAYTGGLDITFSYTNSVGWIGLKTPQSGLSMGCIIG